MVKKVTYPLNIDEDLWKSFKDLVPRTKNLNDALVELIKDEVLAAES